MNDQVRAYPSAVGSLTAAILENDRVRLTLLPQVGGKIISIRSLVSQREFLWQDASRPYRQPRYADAFGNYGASGFDECFPSIGECRYPEFPWEGIVVPDHGEIWCTPAQCELRGDSLYVHTYGVRFPYHFEKWITLAPDAARFDISYRVTNLSAHDFQYCWTAHPLFAAAEGMRIVLPGTPEARFVFALGGRVGGEMLQAYRWPWVGTPDGALLDYSLIGPPTLKANDKVYADSQGWCALHDPASGDYVAFSFSSEALPYVGICINHGGWPGEGVPGYWVALEPCTGYPDPLDEVMALGKHRTLGAHAIAEWSMTLHVGSAEHAEAIGSQLLA